MRIRMHSALSVLLLALVLVACGGGGGDGGACPDDGVDIPDVSGSFLLELGALRSSNCPGQVDQILDDFIADASSCIYDLAQNGARITGTDCDGLAVRGCVDRSGNVLISESDRQSEQGCNVSVDADFEANLSEAEADGTLTLGVRISGRCTLEANCVATVDATASRSSAVTSAMDSAYREGAVESSAVLLSRALSR